MTVWNMHIKPEQDNDGYFITTLSDEKNRVQFPFHNHSDIQIFIDTKDTIQIFFGTSKLELPQRILNNLIHYFSKATFFDKNPTFTCHQFAYSLIEKNYDALISSKTYLSNA